MKRCFMCVCLFVCVQMYRCIDVCLCLLVWLVAKYLCVAKWANDNKGNQPGQNKGSQGWGGRLTFCNCFSSPRDSPSDATQAWTLTTRWQRYLKPAEWFNFSRSRIAGANAKELHAFASKRTLSQPHGPTLPPQEAQASFPIKAREDFFPGKATKDTTKGKGLSMREWMGR